MNTPTQSLSLATEGTCLEYSGCDKAVVECVFEGGHICNRKWQFEPIIDFMLEDLKSNSTSSGVISAMYALISLHNLYGHRIWCVGHTLVVEKKTRLLGYTKRRLCPVKG